MFVSSTFIIIILKYFLTICDDLCKWMLAQTWQILCFDIFPIDLLNINWKHQRIWKDCNDTGITNFLVAYNIFYIPRSQLPGLFYQESDDTEFLLFLTTNYKHRANLTSHECVMMKLLPTLVVRTVTNQIGSKSFTKMNESKNWSFSYTNHIFHLITCITLPNRV